MHAKAENKSHHAGDVSTASFIQARSSGLLDYPCLCIDELSLKQGFNRHQDEEKVRDTGPGKQVQKAHASVKERLG